LRQQLACAWNAAPTEAALSGALRAIRILKGGIALTLFFLDVPRPSVDIDVNYVGQGDLEAMPAAASARTVWSAALRPNTRARSCACVTPPLPVGLGPSRST
jgi:hypothetical protein